MAVKKLTPVLFVEQNRSGAAVRDAASRFYQDRRSMPERTTFYGAREIGVKDPAGHFIPSRSSNRARNESIAGTHAVPAAGNLLPPLRVTALE